MEKFLIESGSLKTYIRAGKRLTIKDYGKAIIKEKPKHLGAVMMARRLSDGQEWHIFTEAVCRKIGLWKENKG